MSAFLFSAPRVLPSALWRHPVPLHQVAVQAVLAAEVLPAHAAPQRHLEMYRLHVAPPGGAAREATPADVARRRGDDSVAGGDTRGRGGSGVRRGTGDTGVVTRGQGGVGVSTTGRAATGVGGSVERKRRRRERRG